MAKVVIAQIRCPNPRCGRVLVNSHETFCPECGTRLPQQAVDAEPVSLHDAPSLRSELSPNIILDIASPSRRAGAFAIDVVIAGVLTPLLLAPVIGQFLVGILWGIYFLFRDINGASIGKMILGIRVVGKDGRHATVKQKLVRNLVLVLPDLAEFLPVLGAFLAPGAFVLVIGMEAIVLLTTGQRLGDKIAGTIVVKRTT